VDRDALVLLLSQGLSLAEIGRRFGRDETTVGYWVQKHGLQAVHAEKHASRGGLARAELEQLIDEGLSVRQIAARTGFSPTAVKHWLARHRLRTQQSSRRSEGREAKRDALPAAVMDCVRHGRTEFRLEGRGAYRCVKCRRERVADRRRKVKEILVAEAGGCCVICGYSEFPCALQFHHLDPTTKSFAIGHQGITRGIDAMRAEAAKCALVCANCHAAVGAGLLTLQVSADKVVAGS
jgi:transposase